MQYYRNNYRKSNPVMDVNDQDINEFINHLKPGQVVDIQLASLSDVRIKPIVIGVDLGRYLLVKFPTKLNPSDFKELLVPGSSVIVRYILEGQHGECVSFSTTIQHVLTVPSRLIFLNYPTYIENRQLRTTEREKTHMPAEISANKSGHTLIGASITGYIIDISAHGCLFSFRPAASKGGLKKAHINIAITIVSQEHPLILSAHVKNNRLDNGHVLVGIMFDESSLEDVALLLAEMAIDSE